MLADEIMLLGHSQIVFDYQDEEIGLDLTESRNSM